MNSLNNDYINSQSEQEGEQEVYVFQNNSIFNKETEYIPNPKKPIGQIMIESGFLTHGQVMEALSIQEKTGEQIGTIVLSKGWITKHNLNRIIRNTGGKLKLGEMLLEKGLIKEKNLQIALNIQKETKLLEGKNIPIGEILIKEGFLSEQDFLETLSIHLGIQYLDISKDNYSIIDTNIVKKINISKNDWLSMKMIPIFCIEREKNDDDENIFKGHLSVVTSDPLNEKNIKYVQEYTGYEVSAYISNFSSIQKGLDFLFSSTFRKTSNEISEVDMYENVKYLNKLIANAILKSVSDIHIEPSNGKILIRFRRHGKLKNYESISIERIDNLINVIKIQANMDISKKFIPQDGSFSRALGGHIVDVRVSTIPVSDKEKIVLRILMQTMSKKTIYDSNFPPRLEKQFIQAISRKNGVVLVTGPTGSGKTTTLHRAIKHISGEDINISTVEDPIEYTAGPYVNQSSINLQKGFGYPQAIKALLRQDPDVIMIGEIRDKETAMMATEAALTGHLVLSTLHTEDAIGSIVRLIHLGVAEWLISSTVVTVLNQRLIRKLCDCAEPIKELPDRIYLRNLELDDHVIDYLEKHFKKFNLKKPVGCNKCEGEGYISMQVVVEQLTLSATVREMIREGYQHKEVIEYIRQEHSMNMIFEEAFRQILMGVSSFEELASMPRGDYIMKLPNQIIKDATETPQVRHIDKKINKINTHIGEKYIIEPPQEKSDFFRELEKERAKNEGLIQALLSILKEKNSQELENTFNTRIMKEALLRILSEKE